MCSQFFHDCYNEDYIWFLRARIILSMLDDVMPLKEEEVEDDKDAKEKGYKEKKKHKIKTKGEKEEMKHKVRKEKNRKHGQAEGEKVEPKEDSDQKEEESHVEKKMKEDIEEKQVNPPYLLK